MEHTNIIHHNFGDLNKYGETEDYYTCQAAEGGFEKYYLLFPRNSLDLSLDLNNAITKVDTFENKTITFLSKYAPIIYEFDFNMQLVGIDLTHKFMIDFENLKKAGKIYSSVDQVQQEILSQGIRYFDGESWTKKVTTTKFWQEKTASSSKANRF